MSKSKIIVLTALITLVFGIAAIDNAVADEKGGKYLILWEVDHTKIAIDPKERAAGWGALMAMVRQDHETGLTTSWGAFVGENSGYTVMEGTELQVMLALARYTPFVTFKTHPLASESHVNAMIKALSGVIK